MRGKIGKMHNAGKRAIGESTEKSLVKIGNLRKQGNFSKIDKYNVNLCDSKGYVRRIFLTPYKILVKLFW